LIAEQDFLHVIHSHSSVSDISLAGAADDGLCFTGSSGHDPASGMNLWPKAPARALAAVILSRASMACALEGGRGRLMATFKGKEEARFARHAFDTSLASHHIPHALGS